MLSYHDEFAHYIESCPKKKHYTLDEVMRITGKRSKNRSRIFKCILKSLPNAEVINVRQGVPRKSKCKIVMTRAGFMQVGRTLRKPNKQQNGILYGFWLAHVPRAFKIGRTVDWQRRQKDYRGFNTPGKIFIMRACSDMRKAESDVIDALNAHAGVTQAPFGNEWFTTDLTTEELLAIIE